jgi:hypothetical protein
VTGKARKTSAAKITAFLRALKKSCGGCRHDHGDDEVARQNCADFRPPEMYGQCGLPEYLLEEAVALLGGRER